VDAVREEDTIPELMGILVSHVPRYVTVGSYT
jgi:hypothetical protein